MDERPYRVEGRISDMAMVGGAACSSRCRIRMAETGVRNNFLIKKEDVGWLKVKITRAEVRCLHDLPRINGDPLRNERAGCSPYQWGMSCLCIGKIVEKVSSFC